MALRKESKIPPLPEIEENRGDFIQMPILPSTKEGEPVAISCPLEPQDTLSLSPLPDVPQNAFRFPPLDDSDDGLECVSFVA